MSSSILNIARRYDEAGFSIIPIRPNGSKAPALASWKEFQARRPNREELDTWFGKGIQHGIGIVWGKISGNGEALDFDEVGLYEEFAALCQEHGHGKVLERLVLVGTPTGGRHLLYRCEEPVPGNRKLAQRLVDAPQGTDGARLINGRWCRVETRIETRGEGGYTLAPGSPAACHSARRPYERLRGDFHALPVLSREERNVLHAIAGVFNEHVEEHKVQDGPKRPRNEPLAGLRPGDDYNERGPVESLLEQHGWERVGSRGETGIWRRPGKDGRGISATTNYGSSGLLYVFSSNAFPFEGEHAYSPFAAYALLEHSGDYEAAARALRANGYGDQTPPGVAHALRATREPEAASVTASRDSAAAAPTFQLTDDGNAERLIHRHGRNLRYCYAWGKWLAFDGIRWRKDEGDIIETKAKETGRGLLREAAECTDTAEQKTLAQHALKMQSYPRMQAMIAMARSNVPVRVEQFDADNWLLCCNNGTVELKTGTLRPHRREDLITKKAGTAYDPEAEAPTWNAFLERILPDEEVRSFIQRAIGYALTGDVSEQCLFFLYGHGSNGKSTLLRALQDAQGDYALQAAPDLLIAKDKSGGPNNDVADLLGARFVSTVEVEDGKRMAEGIVKQITGGDLLKARFMRQDYFTFEPTHKIFLAANHKPTIRGNDHAIWRRIKVLPFEVQISDQEKDAHLPDKLREELPGILAWAVRGCLEWQRIGLAEPDAVKLATAEYREEMDVLRDFLADCCVLRPAQTVTTAGLYKTYCDWCEENSERPLGKKNFGTRIREQPGIHPTAGLGQSAARGWVGIGIRSDRAAPPSRTDISDISDAVLPMNGLYSTPREDNPENTSEMSEMSGDAPEPPNADLFVGIIEGITDPFAGEEPEQLSCFVDSPPERSPLPKN